VVALGPVVLAAALDAVVAPFFLTILAYKNFGGLVRRR
jgi:hypothetical protein